MSLYLRDQLIRQSWIPVHLRPPENDPRGVHYPVQVWGVIDDPRLKTSDGKPFSDVVSYWPALGKWTVTFQCRLSELPDDYPVRVTFWQPLPPTLESWP
jgi:hypothetical protein